MPPDKVEPGSPEDWIDNAVGDMILAEIDPPVGVRLESFCFHAQQAAEKSLKALLLSRNLKFPQTHDIRTLLTLLQESTDVPEIVKDAFVLTEYAVTSRYPGNYEPVTLEDYQEAIQLAKQIHEWVKFLLKRDRPV